MEDLNKQAKADYSEVTSVSAETLEQVAQGHIFVVRDVPEVAELATFTTGYVSEIARRMFGIRIDDDLGNIHQYLTQTQAKELHHAIQKNYDNVRVVPMTIARLLRQAGLERQCLLSVQVHFRLHVPTKDGVGLGATAHRDSWYSLPAEGLNFWMPCTFESDIGLTIFPSEKDRKLRLGPKDEISGNFTLPQFDASAVAAVTPNFGVGDMILFAGDHLHRSAPNTSERTRVSWDYRVLRLEDLQPSLRLHQFVFADLLLARPADTDWQSRETQRRLRTSGALGAWSARSLTSRHPGLSQLGRKFKDAFPNICHR